MSSTGVLLAVGDISPSREHNPEALFSLCVDRLRQADILVGQLETPYSIRGEPQLCQVCPERGHPNAVRALTYAGFKVVSFASNHALDWGVTAFLDTLDLLKEHEILVVGAGRNIEEARRPAIVQVKNTRIAFLSYCSAIMARIDSYIAGLDRPGVAPLKAWTLYRPILEEMESTPGSPARALTFADPQDLRAMVEDIAKTRASADIVVVIQHAGVAMVRAELSMYQREIAHAAIDAGSDLVLQHHAHILRGVEIYKGKAIFYGLGDLGHEAPLHRRQQTGGDPVVLKEMKKAFYTGTEPGWEDWPYASLDSRYTIVVKALFSDKRIQMVSILPAYLNQKMQAQVLSRSDPRAQEVAGYLESITGEENLSTKYTWKDDEIIPSGGTI